MRNGANMSSSLRVQIFVMIVQKGGGLAANIDSF